MDGKAARFGAGVVVFVCFLVAAIEGYDIQAFGVAAPKLIPELGLNPGQQGWAASIAMIGLVAGAAAGGWAADRFGRRPVLLVSVAAFGVFSLMTAAAHSYDMLLAARLLTGVGFGGAMPNLIAVANEMSRGRGAAATVTLMFCGMPVGGAVVALAARLMGEAMDWRALFVAGGLAPLVLVPVMALVLPETRPEHDPTADRDVTRGLLGEGRAAATLLMWLALLLTLTVHYLALNWLPTLAVAQKMSPSDAFGAAFAYNVGGAAGSVLLALAADRMGWRRTLPVAALALTAILWGMSRTDAALAFQVLAAAAGVVLMGVLFVLYAVAPALYPSAIRGVGAGSSVAAGRLGSIIGPLIAGGLRTAGATPGEVFLSMTPVAVISAVAIVLLGRAAKDA